MNEKSSRRGFLKCSLAASGFAAAALGLEEQALLAAEDRTDSKATQEEQPTSDTLPTGTIRHVEMTRLILGGNLIAGVAHARDLRYVSPLVRHYFTDEKIMETWELAERHGVNTMAAWPSSRTQEILKRYRKRGGKIQWLGHTSCQKPFTGIKTCIDHGAIGVYIAGDHTDRYVADGRLDDLAEAIGFIKQNGLIAGVACHPIAVPKACEEAGVGVDFYMKTLHSGDYWSATPPAERKHEVRVGDPTFIAGDHASGHYHDNIWCIRPEETVEYMRTVQKPWMAFKVLAAGAILPRQGFGYAFRGGADFLHVGMFDFQIADDAGIVRRILSGNRPRQRPWRA
ncbi:MAG: hypothetical protein ACYTG0_47715 [Planctomycetota bacterium]